METKSVPYQLHFPQYLYQLVTKAVYIKSQSHTNRKHAASISVEIPVTDKYKQLLVS